jgi:hypothetical protein
MQSLKSSLLFSVFGWTSMSGFIALSSEAPWPQEQATRRGQCSDDDKGIAAIQGGLLNIECTVRSCLPTLILATQITATHNLLDTSSIILPAYKLMGVVVFIFSSQAHWTPACTTTTAFPSTCTMANQVSNTLIMLL